MEKLNTCSPLYFLEVYYYLHTAFTSKAVGFPGVTTSHEGDKKRSHGALAKPPPAKPWQTDGLGCRRSSRASQAIFVTCLSQRKLGAGIKPFKSRVGGQQWSQPCQGLHLYKMCGAKFIKCVAPQREHSAELWEVGAQERHRVGCALHIMCHGGTQHQKRHTIILKTCP